MNGLDLADSFHYAVTHGYLSIIDQVLKTNFDVNSLGRDKNTALYNACCAGNAQMVNKLLAAGADPFIASRDGDTPLHAAIVQSQNITIARALIKAKPELITVPNAETETPLHVAAELGFEEAVREILKGIKRCEEEAMAHGRPINNGKNEFSKETKILEAVNMDGETPLFVATQAGRIEVIHMLLNAKANALVQNKYGKSPIDWAVTKATIDVVRRLLDAETTRRFPRSKTQDLLQRAAFNGTPEVVKLLLERKADINAPGSEGMTALHWAAKSRNPANLEILLQAGANVNEPVRDSALCAGFTALHFAAERGTTNVVRKLLDVGADVESRCNQGQTPLICSAKAKREDLLILEVVTLLVESGADVNARDFQGRTALHYAVGPSCFPKPFTAQMLLDMGIHPYTQDSAGDTAMDLAVQHEEGDILKVLRDAKLIKECTICCNVLSLTKFPQTDHWAKHDICGPCGAAYLHAEIQGNGKTRLFCPSESCQTELEYEDIRLVSDAVTFSRFEKLMLDRMLETNPNFRWCANSSCSAGQIIANGDNISYFTCFSCGMKSCFSCRTLAHSNMTCLEYQAFLLAEKTPTDAATTAWLNRNTRRCTCNAPIEKNDGCDHMTCTRCGAEWCWLCGAEYNKIRRLGNTAHLRNCRYYA